MKYVLALDPSGSFYEGKGTTGWVLMEAKQRYKLLKSGTICAKDYPSIMEYFKAHIDLLEHINASYGGLSIGYGHYKNKPLHIVIEDYRLYGSKARSQINSNLETSQLIGVLRYWCYSRGIPYKMQMASEVKQRWSDSILYHYGVDLPQSRHTKDALRHAMHYIKFGGKI